MELIEQMFEWYVSKSTLSIQQFLCHQPFYLILVISVHYNHSFSIATEYLRDTMEVFSDSCVQYLIYHRKRSISNIKRIIQMMERYSFKQVKNVKSQNIATFVSKSSPLWKKQ